VRDIDNASGPHRPVSIPYRMPLGFFKNIDDIAHLLCTEEPYQKLMERIEKRFPPSYDAMSTNEESE
jgi:hypothetical protein